MHFPYDESLFPFVIFIYLSIVIILTISISVMLIKCCLLFYYYTIFIIYEYYYQGGYFQVVVYYWARRSLAFSLPWRFMPGTEENEGNAEAVQGDVQPWLAWRVPKFHKPFPIFLYLFLRSGVKFLLVYRD